MVIYGNIRTSPGNSLGRECLHLREFSIIKDDESYREDQTLKQKFPPPVKEVLNWKRESVRFSQE